MRFKVILGSIVVVAMLVAGCGGGGGDTTGGATSGGTTAGASTGDSSVGASTGDSTSGGDSSTDGGESASKPLTKLEFIREGDSMCATVPPTYQENSQKLAKENKAQGKPKASLAEVNLKAAVPPIHTLAEGFEGLAPPTGDEDEVEAIIDSLDAAAKGLEAEPTAPLSGPKSPFAEFQELSKKYGFKSCPGL